MHQIRYDSVYNLTSDVWLIFISRIILNKAQSINDVINEKHDVLAKQSNKNIIIKHRINNNQLIILQHFNTTKYQILYIAIKIRALLHRKINSKIVF